MPPATSLREHQDTNSSWMQVTTHGTPPSWWTRGNDAKTAVARATAPSTRNGMGFPLPACRKGGLSSTRTPAQLITRSEAPTASLRPRPCWLSSGAAPRPLRPLREGGIFHRWQPLHLLLSAPLHGLHLPVAAAAGPQRAATVSHDCRTRPRPVLTSRAATLARCELPRANEHT